MKKNELANSMDFALPTKQSYVAILLIIWKTYTVIAKQAWPFLVIFLFKGSNKSHFMLYAVAIVAVLGMLYSVLHYFRYYFYVKDGELIIESGVLQRSKLNVAFDRIQTINLEQNIIHRIFDVVRLKIDTAGSSKTEFKFEALDTHRANRLREIVLKGQITSSNADMSLPDGKVLPTYQPIMRLDIGDLLKAGLVQNHFKSGGLIIAFIYWIWQSLNEVNMSDTVEETVYSELSGSMLIFGVLIGLFIILSMVVSLFRMIFTNYNLEFLRSQNGFKLRAGLFTTKDTSALDHKIQMISWSDNPLKRWLGIKDLTLKQASSITINANKALRVPGCNNTHIEKVLDSLYSQPSIDKIAYQPINVKYWHRKLMILGPIITGIVIFLSYLGVYQSAVGISLLGIYILLSFYIAYKKKVYGNDDQLIAIKGGAIGDKVTIIPIYKLQGIKKSQSPYQRRHHLANLTLYTAAGSVKIPYMESSNADRLMDIYLDYVETDRRSWM